MDEEFDEENYDEDDSYENEDFYPDEGYESDLEFMDPGGRSALRAETADNPRNLPCPECHRANMLTAKDRRLGYRCDICADEHERNFS